MKNKEIVIGKDFSLPLNVTTKRLAFLGTTGSGKSYAGMKIVEGMIKNGIQTIILDPVGIHWGLRLSANGKDAGIPIDIFGGLHADVPITPTSGELIANVIVEKKISAVIDVSQFEYDTDKATFVRDFSRRFFFLKKAKPSPVNLVLEEGQEFLPEEPQKNELMMLHNMIRIWKIGRNFGIGGMIISQRPQEVSKKALNLSQAVFAFQTNGYHEREAIERWMKTKGIDTTIAADLPSLPVGTAHLWSPGWLGVSRVVKIGQRWTFHPSEEDTVVFDTGKLKKLSPVTIAKLSDAIQKMVEETELNDPSKLKARVAELERAAEKSAKELEFARNTPKVDTKAINEMKEKIAISLRLEFQKKLLRVRKDVEKSLSDAQKDLIGLLNHLSEAIEGYKLKGGSPILFSIPKSLMDIDESEITAEVNKFLPSPSQAVNSDRILNGLNLMSGGQRKSGKSEWAFGHGMFEQPVNTEASKDDYKLSPKKRAVLTAIAQSGEPVTRIEIMLLSGAKKSTVDTYLQQLLAVSFIIPEGDGFVATEAGKNALGNFESMPKGEALIEWWINKLTGGELAIFNVLWSNHSFGSLVRADIVTASKYAKSSVDTYLQRLAARKLVVISANEIKLNPKLFS